MTQVGAKIVSWSGQGCCCVRISGFCTGLASILGPFCFQSTFLSWTHSVQTMMSAFHLPVLVQQTLSFVWLSYFSDFAFLQFSVHFQSDDDDDGDDDGDGDGVDDIDYYQLMNMQMVC